MERSEYHGEASEQRGLTTFLDGLEVIRAESMDLNNDPRFFSSNVLDKRLKAFAGLSLVSGLMVGNSIGQCFSMPKDMDLSEWPGIVQLVAFLLMNCVLFMDVTAVVVLVHQLFYTYRLMTAGPTGFEIAATFYLNGNIIMFRHLAIKCLLLSLPIFLTSSGLSLLVAFHRDSLPAAELAKNHELDMRTHDIMGGCVFASFAIAAVVILCIRWTHLAIFRERYELVKEKEKPLLTHVQSMSARRTAGGLLDT
eukprot:gnl/TRDRNA2_/TRDRNA2_171199_c0_seq14.p1 gnl/TRDRNA2_/TRDRNA2_171199_c0~~gnl/TRDRNA2_/TRDRNA2_171199_c0_seq14.p1  ORF type:complete len:252 (-),score=38.73 gnl/TRDRNA2_/TRDRNA2_171199_c0_seq14:71-826(-)